MKHSRRGFSLVELLIALTISAMLLTACMVALDASFKAYEVTTDSASTHVVSRMVMYRTLAMIRGGQEFGPYPVGVIKPTRINSNYIEFVSFEDTGTGERQVTRLEREDDPSAGAGMFKLMFKRWDYLNGTETNHVEYPILRNIIAANFELEYDRGARLMQATVDMTVRPDDDTATKIESQMDTPVLRLVASTSPRRLNE
ncbi:MAG: prepilin-type N-terminal cleavage/methylation domain-containing protein [Phycisphaerales bacterium]|nr:prepilin-type N-terminal cleavage/methylation domain-containing protein [Phycisphaerales bacterium]